LLPEKLRIFSGVSEKIVFIDQLKTWTVKENEWLNSDDNEDFEELESLSF
jgi:hypothetical protein